MFTQIVSLIKKELMFKKLVLIFTLFPSFIMAQHSIKGVFFPAEKFEYAILYRVTPSNAVYVANTEISDDGYFEFQLDSTATQGMYRLVYALPQEEYNFDIIYNAKENVELTFNSEIGVQYQSSVENRLVSSYTNSMSLVSQSIGNFYQQQSNDTLALESIFKTQRQTQARFETAAKGTIAACFIKANRPYIPEGFEDMNNYIQNLKEHFFDYVDFNNETLQCSNFLIERILNYVFGISSQDNDELTTFKKNIDEVYLAMKEADNTVKANLLEILWQQMVDVNFEEVANYISDAYLMEIANTLNDEELMNGLALFKSLSTGNIAPDFALDIEENNEESTKMLSTLNTADQYVVIFWNSTCSHCLKEMPQLQSYVKSLEEGKIQVIAIGLEDEPNSWQIESSNYPEFIHVLGLGKWENDIGNSYNVTSTPIYYILDKGKKIIAKPYDFEALKKFMDREY